MVVNRIPCITHIQQKTKNLALNNVNLVVTQKQLIRLLVIQKLTHLQQYKNLSPKHKNENTCITKKLQSKNYAMESQITKSDLWSHNMGLYPITNIPNVVHT